MMIKNRKQQGFTLLEALIGFLILSVGMLGIASLQAISLKAGKTSVYSSIATMKAEEIIESMRANPSVLNIYTGAGNNNNCTGANSCDETQLAEYDVFMWNQNLNVGMPGNATGVIVVTDPVSPSKLATVDVTLTWSERDKDSTGSVDKSYSVSTTICTGLPC